MKSKFLSKNFVYDGTQLTPLYAYQNHGILGSSIISWIGPCDISFEHMVDLEDFRDHAEIKGDLMLHFIVEIFDRELFTAVCLQRLFASLCKDLIEEKTNLSVSRSGDDLYIKNRKLSISIASRSSVSCQIHFAMNITQKGTPVPTSCFEKDLKLKPQVFAQEIMQSFVDEYQSILDATQKVVPL